METYLLYRGHKPNGNILIMAIQDFEIKDGNKPEDFFSPNTGPIEKIGEIEIDGDEHYLNNSFAVTT